MPTAVVAAAAWSDQRRPLWCGIPARIAALGADPDLLADCWRLLVGIEAVISVFDRRSELARLNTRGESDGAPLSWPLAKALQAALEAWRLSRGACDATAAPLVALWREAVREQCWPSPEAIAAALALVGCAGIAIDDDRLRCPGRRVAFDLGGVAKGMLVDQVDRLLAAAGVEHALVQIGGETSCRGRSPSGRPWRIGVQHPLLPQAMWTTLVATEEGLSCSTSADYRRAWRIGERPVSHLVDPRTGAPADDDLLGATIAIPRAGRAGATEALTKAAIFLAPEDAIDAARAVDGELLVLRAVDAGIDEAVSPRWRTLEAR